MQVGLLADGTPQICRVSGECGDAGASDSGCEQQRHVVRRDGPRFDQLVLRFEFAGSRQRCEVLPQTAIFVGRSQLHDILALPLLGGEHLEFARDLRGEVDLTRRPRVGRIEFHRKPVIERRGRVTADAIILEATRHEQARAVFETLAETLQQLGTEHFGRDITDDEDVVAPRFKPRRIDLRLHGQATAPDLLEVELNLVSPVDHVEPLLLGPGCVEIGDVQTALLDGDDRCAGVVSFEQFALGRFDLDADLQFTRQLW